MDEFEKKLAKSLVENGHLIPESINEVKMYLDQRELEDVPSNIELDLGSDIERHKYDTRKKTKPAPKLLSLKRPNKGLDTLDKRQVYFRRVVLAGEIVKHLHAEYTFGHVKFMKLMYLCEKICEYNLEMRYSKQAAGPMDNRFIHSIDKEFKKQKWFEVRQEGPYNKYVYRALPGLSKQREYYSKYYSDYDEKIQWLISIFRSNKTEKVELIATIFACWEELLADNSIINDSIIISKVYKWSKEKKKFSEDKIIEGIRWMENNNLFPR
ncbi:MAG: hypothetical protein RIC35_09970 [Marinoscillum sp.]